MPERSGLWSILESPVVYEAFHTLIGARRWMHQFVSETIRPKPGDHVLDIGCGPGALLNYLPADVTYTGIDYSEASIARARRKHNGRGHFICADVDGLSRQQLAPVSIAVAIGTLHHLDDDAAIAMLRATASILERDGRLIAVDPCFHPDQNLLERTMAKLDRGAHVRPFEQYSELCGRVFAKLVAEFQRSPSFVPHSMCIIQAS